MVKYKENWELMEGKVLKKSIIKVILVMLVTLIISLVLAALTYINGEGNNNAIDFFISVMALVVSIIALIMALLTYFSIDSVNTKSTLEGNVLENEAYTISLVNRLKEYGAYEDDADIMERIFAEQHRILSKRSLTNIQTTDALQMLIDDYAILGWCNQRTSTFHEMANKSLQLVEKRIEKLRDFSNGSQHVVEENYKLIKYLYSGTFSREMLDGIRGDLFMNPYTRYLYFDSIGRQYCWEIAPCRGIRAGCVTINEFREMKEHVLSDNERYKMKLWIDKSMEAINYANNIPIYNKPYTVFINNFIFRLNLLQSIYFGIDNVKESYEKNRDDWYTLKMQLGIDYNDMQKSYMWTSIFKSYYRLFFSYHAYCAVFSTIPETWLEDVTEFYEQYKKLDNMSPHERLINLEPSIKELKEMKEIYYNTYMNESITAI